MSISKRKDRHGKNRWLVRIESPDPVTGARRRISVGTFATKRQAEIEEAKAITNRDRGTLLAPDTTTVGELLDRYIETEMPKTVAPENQQEYRIVCDKHLKPALGQIKVRRLTAEHIDALYGDLRERGYSSSLIRKVHQRLSTTLRMAVRWQLVARNVAADVTPPKITAKKPPKVWTPGEAAQFLATAKAGREPLLPFWALMLDTGSRTSELLGVSWHDLDLDAGTVRIGAQVVRLKGGTPTVKVGGKTEAATRTVRITTGTVDMIKDHRKTWLAAKLAAPDWQNEHDLVFVSRSGRPLNARNVRRAFDRVVQQAGVTALSPHGLRKTAITSALAAGAPLRAVMGRVGHKDPNTTLKVYTSLTRGMEDDLLDVVDALMNAVPDRLTPDRTEAPTREESE